MQGTQVIQKTRRITAGFAMVGVERVELPTPAMSTQCSTTELYAHAIGHAQHRKDQYQAGTRH